VDRHGALSPTAAGREEYAVCKKALIFAVVSAALVATALASSASASGPPTVGSGAFTEPSSTVVSVKQAGPVTFVVLDNVVDWTGTISGEAQETLFISIKPSGDAVFQGVDVFPDGRRISLTGKDSGGAFDGTFTLTGPVGSNGHGTFQGFDNCPSGGVCGTYMGNFVN
jgi:hypothetical protein